MLFVSKYGKGCNISVKRLSYSANHNTLESWPIRARLVYQNEELCKNHRGSERSNNNVQYVENNVFFNLKPHKHRITPNTQNNVLFSILIYLSKQILTG